MCIRDSVKANGISVRRGHTLLTNLVASGEVPLALTVYNYKAEQLKNQGAPIDWFVIGEAGQRILAKRDFVPTNKKVDTPLNKVPLEIVDPKVMLDQHDKWTKLY